jgi:hypothetical protein
MERGLDAIASDRSKPHEHIFMPLLLPAIVAAFRTLRMPAIALGLWRGDYVLLYATNPWRVLGGYAQRLSEKLFVDVRRIVPRRRGAACAACAERRMEMNAIATKAMRCSFERSKMMFNRR